MNNAFSRRGFLRRALLASTGLALPGCVGAPRRAAAPSTTILHASIGVGGMGASDLKRIADHPFVKLVAVADVDLPRAAAWKKQFPNLRIYQDWRQLLDKEKQLDSLNISTPDHMHAPIAMSAMQLGKHVYCQKPLAHDIFEVRQLSHCARKHRTVTQMGIQIHAYAEYRLGAQLVHQGAIGSVKEVHSWTSKSWGDPRPKPERADRVPAGLDWDGWLGVEAARPFIQGYYHPGNWRRTLDFGTGTFGDMGCHLLDPVFDALALEPPLSVRSEGAAPNQWHWANRSLIHYEIRDTPFTAKPRVKVSWYDGGQLPPPEIQSQLEGQKLPEQGSVFLGTRGTLLLPHIGRPELFPRQQFAGFSMPEVASGNHYTLFLEAVRGNGKTAAGFSYSGPLTETVLLGGVASRFPQTTLEWNSSALRVSNLPDANRFVRRSYRHGWEVSGI